MPEHFESSDPNTSSGVDREINQKLLEIVRIADSKDPSQAIDVIYAPPIMGELPSPETSELFSAANDNLYAVKINDQYTSPDIESYLQALIEELKTSIPDLDLGKLYLIGFSASCNMVAKTAQRMGLPKEQVLLGAPIWSPKHFLRERIHGVLRSIRHRTSISQAFGIDMDYGRRLSQLRRDRTSAKGYDILRRFAFIPPDELSSGTVFSGRRDAVSPRTHHTDIYLPDAGHQFSQFAQKIVEYIESRRNISRINR